MIAEVVLRALTLIGRHDRGCFIPGDSPSIVLTVAKSIAMFTINALIRDADWLDHVQEQKPSLVVRWLHDQAVLAKLGMDLPQVDPFPSSDLGESLSEQSADGIHIDGTRPAA